MKVLVPVAIGEAALLSSSIAETEYAAWSNATTYAANVRVVHAHRVWISAQGSNLAQTPGADDTWWVDEGPTNRWAMFDQSPGTVSSAASTLTVTLQPGAWVNAVALVSAVCRTARVQVLASDGVTVLYDQTQELTSIQQASWHGWFMRDRFRASDDVVFEGLPRRVTGRIVVTLEGPGTVSLGVLAVGVQHAFGQTLAESESDQVDYSRVLIDEFGGVSITRRGVSRQGRFTVLIDNADLRRLVALRAAVSSLPCVWSGATGPRMRSALLAYGLATRMPITVKNEGHSIGSLEVQGFA